MASDALPADTTGRRVAWLDRATRRLEGSPAVDRLSPVVAALAQPFNRPPLADVLRGTWLGHALHPLLTDVPIGCWVGALILDVFPGRERASRSLVGAGVAAVPLTLVAGLAEWETMTRPEERRVATVHAVGNAVAAVAFLRSWQDRRAMRQTKGVAWSLVGGGLAVATAYLGGHLSYARRVGTGSRGRPSQRGALTVKLVPSSERPT